MPDSKKNNSRNSDVKKSGPSSAWMIELVVLVSFALILGLLIASITPPAGAIAFLLLLLPGYFIVPRKGRRLFKLGIIALTIAMTLLSIFWQYVGSDATEFSDGPTTFAVIVAFLGFSMLIGTVIVALTILAGTWIIAPWVRSVGGHAEMEEGELRNFLIRSYLGVSPSYLVFAGEKIAAQSPAGIMQQFGGPGLAIIKPQTAVVFEHMGTVSRVTGPATLNNIKMFELSKAVVDLRPQWDTTGVFEVSTQDGEQVQVSARYQCAIMNRKELGDQPCPTIEETETANADKDNKVDKKPAKSEPGALAGAPEYCEDTIRRAVYDCGPHGWQHATRETVCWALRTEIERRTVEELFPALNPVNREARPDELTIISDAVLERAGNVTARWGVKVQVLSLDQIVPPQTVTEATRAMRQSRVAAENVVAAGRAEAGVYAGLQTVEAQAQEAKLRILVRHVTSVADELPNEQVLAFFELVENVARIIINHRTVDYRYVQALEALSENPNARIIIQPGNSGILVENVME